jgi:DNA-binding NtrC family response regulator
MFFDPEAFDYLKQIKWTGNIRELRNVVERLTILCDGKITGEDVKKYAMV